MKIFEPFKNYSHLAFNYCCNKTNEIYKYAPPKNDLKVRASQIGKTAIGLLFIGAAEIFNQSMTSSALLTGVTLGTSSLATYLAFKRCIIPTFREWTLNKLSEDQSKLKVVLFCRAAFDSSGAATALDSKQIKAFRKLSETHSIVHVKIRDIDSLNKAIEAIEKNGCKIQTLWMSVHGDQNLLAIGNEVVDEEGVEKINFSKLDENANIVLAACSVGAQIEDDLSIAEWVQIYAGPQKMVYAPTDLLPWDGTYCTIEETQTKWNFKYRNTDISADISYDEVFKKAKKLDFLL